MIISLCGTPGVGKTTAAEVLSGEGWGVIDLRKLLSSSGLFSKEEGTGELIVDVDQAHSYLEKELSETEKDIIVEGHLSYLAPWDLCIVMRLHPAEVRKRLENRGYPASKIEENVEAEAVGILLVEAVQESGGNDGRTILELDCTGLDEVRCSREVSRLLDLYYGKKLNELERYAPGSVDWLEVMEEWY